MKRTFKAAYQFTYFSLRSDTKYAHTEVMVLENSAGAAKKLADSLVESEQYDKWRLDKVTDFQLLINRHEQAAEITGTVSDSYDGGKKRKGDKS